MKIVGSENAMEKNIEEAMKCTEKAFTLNVGNC
jgi:hypothetical protein